MKKMYTWLCSTILFVLLVVTPQGISAQSCTADAGTLSISQSLYCPGETITVTITGDKPNFATQFLLADTLNVFLEVGNTTGQFSGLSEGTYRVFAINFDPNNQPVQPPVVGGTIGDIQDISVNCFDIGTSVTFSVGDNIAPVAVCSVDPVTVYLDAQGGFDVSAADLDFGSFDDGCSGITDRRLDQSVFGCTDIGPQQVALIVEDGSGNTDTCYTTLQIQDTLAPLMQCAPPATVALDNDGAYQPDLFAIDDGTADNCELGQLWLSQTTFTCQDTGMQELYLIAEDGQGNQDSCRWTFTLIDDTPPTALCQTDITRYLDANGQIALAAADLDNGSVDNCGVMSRSVTPALLDCSAIGIQEAYLKVTDASGHTAMCTTLVDVIDNAPPIAACVSAVPLYLDEAGQGTLPVAAVDNGSTDNCSDNLTLTLSKTNFSCTDLGSENVILTATDGVGQSDQCTTSVSVLDTLLPQAVCTPVTISLDENGLAALSAGQVDGGSTDNCGISGMTLSQEQFSCSDRGGQEVVLTVEDVAGLTDTCRATVTIVDDQAPEAFCQDITIYLSTIGSAAISAADIDNGSRDNCGLSARAINRPVFGCADLGQSTVTLTVRDDAGNEDQCTSTITVRDTVSPVALCQAVTLYLDEFGQTTLQPEMVNNNSRDNCGSLSTLLLSEYVYFCDDIGQNTVTLFVTDASGNSGSCQAPVTVVDTVSPQASCRDITVYLNERGVATLSPDTLDNGSIDNCSAPLVFEADQERFTCSDLGTQAVVMTAIDPYGNKDSCTAQVTILDTIPPNPVCQAVTLYLDESGRATLSPQEVNTNSSDNCGLPSALTLSQSLFDCSDVGTNPLILSLEDPSGNSAQCTTSVTVQDTVSPVASCRDFVLEVGINGQARLTPDLINDASLDNCTSPLQFELSRTAFSCADLGPNTVVLTAIDDAQNIDTCQATVTVIDSKLPEVRTQDIVVYLAEDGSVTISPQDVENGSTDNCSIIDAQLDRQTFGCADTGPNLVSLTLTDIDGNMATETAVVFVLDTLAPALTCATGITVRTSEDGGDNCTFVLDDQRLDPLSVSDNCSLRRLQHDFASASSDSTLQGTSFPTGTHDITWTLTDENGQASTCTVAITVQDDETPVARCRDTVLVQLSEAGLLTLDSARIDLGSTDNCGITSYELSRTEFTCSDVGYRLVSAKVTDGAGNTTQCTVVVGITASEACPNPAVSNNRIGQIPEISDPCSCRGDGSFDETVVIGPTTSGQAWTVNATDLLNPATLLPYAPGTSFTEIDQGGGSSLYILHGVHLSGEGYTVVAESPMFTENLSISNVCYYPEPEIIGLNGPVCLFTNAISLEGTGGPGVSGVGSFTINGQPATVFDPATLGIGVHTVSYTFDAGNPAGAKDPPDIGCAVTVTKEVEVLVTPENLACNDLVTVTVNAGCEILIRPEMVLSGNYLCYDDYAIFISYQGQAVPNPVPAEFAGLLLNTLVQHKPSGRICFGDIRLRDVQGPQIDSCASDIRDRFVCTDLSQILNNPATIDPASPYYTGRPAVEDNCSGTELTFQDQLVDLDDCAEGQETAYIRRRFFAEDKFGNVSTCDQFIYFERPQSIQFPSDTLIREDCTADPVALNAQGNVDPAVSGWPYYVNGFGESIPITGSNNSCGFSVFYDDTRIDQCAAQYIVLREWVIFDACTNQTLSSVTQRIDVGDYDAPVVSCPAVDLNFDGLVDAVPVYSTGPADCTANLAIPQPEVEECSDYTVSTRIYSWVPETNFGFPTGDTLFQELNGVTISNNVASNIPVGEHYFVYTVRDVCGNTTMDTCLFRVEDRVSPTVFCDDDIVVSIGSAGSAFVLPGDIDEGSRDNCDDQDLDLELRRLLPADCHPDGIATYTEWGESVAVNCCDVGRLVTVELRARDQSGNTNVCVSRLRVEDKVRPECIAPIDLKVDCNDLPADFDPTDRTSLQRRFGLPDVMDNCQATASWQELSPAVDVDECGFGTITRQFRASDGFGNVSSGACEQVITVEAVHHYRMRFPADTATNCVEPQISGVLFEEIACDLLAVNVESDTFLAAIEGCFKIHRTYQVINWCEYDGISAPVILPRNADCDATPGDEALWVSVEPDGTVFLDRDADPANTIPPAGEKSTSCDGLTNPAGYWISNNQQAGYSSRGFWSYTQHITVYDDTPPVLTISPVDSFCTNDKETCTAPVAISFQVEEGCSVPADLTIAARLDAGSDGTFDDILGEANLTGTYPAFTITGSYPIGQHTIELSVSDGCGNTSMQRIPFVVYDCQAPAPICINGLSVELGALPGDKDVDGDGMLDLASAKVAAMSMVASAIDDCSGPVTYSLNRQGAAADQAQDSILLTCVDEGTVLVELHAWDIAGNHSFCATYIEVQNNGDVCTDIPEGEIMGQVSTETGMTLPEVTVRLSGTASRSVRTDTRGRYRFAELEEGGDYSIIPLFEDNPANGITTFDLILIRRHILGMGGLDTPYKLIAADVNNSGTITVLDMIQLQRMILGYIATFPDNRSWRFVDASYNFPMPKNPWAEGFPEVYNVNNLEAQISGADFVAVKIGDVNHTVNPPGAQAGTIRSTGSDVRFAVDDQQLSVGESTEVSFFLPEVERLEGYQFTLQYDPEVVQIDEVIHGLAGPEQFGYFPGEGILTTHWFRTGKEPQGQQRLFTLRLRSEKVQYISEAIQLTSRITAAEAYRADGTTLQPVLSFRESTEQTDAFRLYPNVPNPFREETTIRIYVPQATEGTLTIYESNGRVVQQLEQAFPKGMNEVRVNRAGLPAGILYYRFECAAWQATRKMILLR